MKKIVKNKGIVINAMTYQETAAIATLITENGKHTCLIKGAKKLNGSNKRLINIPVLIEYQSTVSDSLSVLTEGVVLDNFTNIKDDIIRYNYASIILEKLLYFSEQVTDFKTLFNFTLEILKRLSDSNYLNSLVLIFEIKLLYLLGVAPSFNYCPICGKTNYVGSFDIKQGGYLCEECSKYNEVTLNKEDSKLFKEIYVTKTNKITDEFLIKFNNHQNINKAINYYYEWHLEFNSKAKKIVEKIG